MEGLIEFTFVHHILLRIARVKILDVGNVQLVGDSPRASAPFGSASMQRHNLLSIDFSVQANIWWYGSTASMAFREWKRHMEGLFEFIFVHFIFSATVGRVILDVVTILLLDYVCKSGRPNVPRSLPSLRIASKEADGNIIIHLSILLIHPAATASMGMETALSLLSAAALAGSFHHVSTTTRSSAPLLLTSYTGFWPTQ
eukprot:scaffold265069_cov14-Prasinocladus_malaysianus.AAC.1